MNREDFINAGYTRWDPNPYHEFETDMFEKLVSDEKGKRYFIHVERWDFSVYEQGYIRYEATVQFETKDGLTVSIECLHGWTIEEMEKYYADLWGLGWFKYYEAKDGHRDEVESQY